LAGPGEGRDHDVLPLHVKVPIWFVLVAASWLGVYLAISLIF
jgi:hypothetical protein